MLPTKFQVNWLLDLGEEAKKRFSRWPPWQPSWISNQHDFSYFWSTSYPDAYYQVWTQEKKRKIDFQDGDQGGHLGFSIGTILATFDLQVTPMLPTKFRVNWHFGLGEQAKNRFSRFRIGKIIAIFDLHVTPMLPSKFGVNWPFGSGEEAKNRFSRQLPWQPSWISDRNNLSYFLSTSHPNASYQVWSQLAFGFRRRSEK